MTTVCPTESRPGKEEGSAETTSFKCFLLASTRSSAQALKPAGEIPNLEFHPQCIRCMRFLRRHVNSLHSTKRTWSRSAAAQEHMHGGSHGDSLAERCPYGDTAKGPGSFSAAVAVRAAANPPVPRRPAVSIIIHSCHIIHRPSRTE